MKLRIGNQYSQSNFRKVQIFQLKFTRNHYDIRGPFYINVLQKCSCRSCVTICLIQEYIFGIKKVQIEDTFSSFDLNALIIKSKKQKS